MASHKTIPGPCPIHVEMHGDTTAPCIVLILGLGMQLSDWPQAFLSTLSLRFHVICVENRDMGRSGRCGRDNEGASDQQSVALYSLFDMRDDVLRVLDNLEVNSFAIVGFSMGGMIAQLVAERAGARLWAFAQICSTAGEADAPIPNAALMRFLRTSAGFDTQAELRKWLMEDISWCAAPSLVSEDAAKEAARTMIEGGFTTGGYARQLAAIQTAGDRTDYVKRIEAPALVIAAAQDRCLQPESSNRAHQLLPNSDLMVFDDMGHSLEPKALTELARWLNEQTLVR